MEEGIGQETEKNCCYCCKLKSPRLSSSARRVCIFQRQSVSYFCRHDFLYTFLFIAVQIFINCLISGFNVTTLEFAAHYYAIAAPFYAVYILGGVILFPLVSVYCPLFIHRYFRSCRKPMTPHDLSLTAVLLSLYRRVPLNNVLKRIEEKAKLKLKNMCTSIQKKMSCENVEIKLSGSTAERFNSPLSPHWFTTEEEFQRFHALWTDYDFMIVPDFKISSNTHASSQYHFQMDHSSLKTGFVYVFQKESQTGHDTLLSAKKTVKAVYENVLSLRLCDFHEEVTDKNCCGMLDNSSHVTMHGPAIVIRLGSDLIYSSNSFYADVTFALKCNDWPSAISDWANRPYRKWPSSEDVRKIISEGCHVVPKSQINDKQGLTWRLSFSAAEVELSKLIPPIARMCFIGIKVIARDYLSITCKRIKSYHMKTIFLYTMEKTDPSVWSPDKDVKTSFHILLNKVKEAIASRQCPHFWIQQINLFENLTKQESIKLLKKIEKIEQSPEKYIEDMYVRIPEVEDKLEEVVVIKKDIGGPNYDTLGN